MTRRQSGFMSNAYSYDRIDVENGPWNSTLGSVGAALGSAIAESRGLGTLGKMTGEKAGEAAGSALGYMIDNSTKLTSNVNTFIKEINDWRSWHHVMSTLSGGGIAP